MAPGHRRASVIRSSATTAPSIARNSGHIVFSDAAALARLNSHRPSVDPPGDPPAHLRSPRSPPQHNPSCSKQRCSSRPSGTQLVDKVWFVTATRQAGHRSGARRTRAWRRRKSNRGVDRAASVTLERRRTAHVRDREYGLAGLSCENASASHGRHRRVRALRREHQQHQAPWSAPIRRAMRRGESRGLRPDYAAPDGRAKPVEQHPAIV